MCHFASTWPESLSGDKSGRFGSHQEHRFNRCGFAGLFGVNEQQLAGISRGDVVAGSDNGGRGEIPASAISEAAWLLCRRQFRKEGHDIRNHDQDGHNDQIGDDEGNDPAEHGS